MCFNCDRLECCMVPNEILEGSLLKEFRTSETKGKMYCHHDYYKITCTIH